MLTVAGRKHERQARATSASATGETGSLLRLTSRMARSNSAVFAASNASSRRPASAAMA